MKQNLKSIFLLLLATGLFLATACKKDENEEPPIDPRPHITFKDTAGYTAADGDFMEGDEVKIGVVATQNTITKKNLSKFTLTQNRGGESTVVADESISIVTFNKDYDVVLEIPGSYSFTARITDEDDNFAEVSFNITVDEAPDPRVNVKKNSGIELGSVNDTVGSFYAAAIETVYRVDAAAENQEKVDFIFWKDHRVHSNSIVSPDNEAIAAVNALGIQGWEVKNPTRFIKTDMGVEAFLEIEDKYLFPEFDAAASVSIANHLENGDILFFRTQDGKHGYIRIIDLYNRGDRALIDVIIEE
jgi:hypothetical protein